MQKRYSNCILVISHSNYLIKGGGLEKFIRDYCKILDNYNIHYIHLFPIIEINRKTQIVRREFAGISLDNCFLGVWSIDKIANIVKEIVCERSYHLANCQIHHLHGWNIEMLSKELKQLNIPVYFMVHDLESIAPYMNRRGSDKKCKTIVPVAGSNEICEECVNRKKCVNEYRQIKYALSDLHSLIRGVYVPSENTKDFFMGAYPDFKNIVFVREHLIYEMVRIKRKINTPMRIAYLGSIAEHKGYLEWEELVESLPTSKYSFYYFGSSKITDNRVISVKVDARDSKLKSMTEQLQNYNIDIAFLWSKCPETFCYTYYEAIAAGSFVLTNRVSGNIYDKVEKYNNGKAFKAISDCLEYLNDDKLTRKFIENYINFGKKPDGIRPNNALIGNLTDYLCENKNALSYTDRPDQSRIRKAHFISLIYSSMRMRKHDN